MYKLRIFTSAFCLLLIFFITFILFYLQILIVGEGPLEDETIVLVKTGSSLSDISEQLEDFGVIPSSIFFKLYTIAVNKDEHLKAGEYLFEPNQNMRSVLNKLVKNDILIRYITIPEGLTSFQVIKLINSADGLKGKIDQEITEGTILPETYGYTWGERRIELLVRMKTALEVFVKDTWSLRKDNIPFSSIKEAIILASIIEKETAVDSERNLISAVFHNRLRKGMRLQSDPTVVYGIDSKGYLGRELTRADIRKHTDFNTYKIKGFPPSPICHAGKKSIKAALNPADIDYLYFVANGTGGHAFAKTLKAHNKNVTRWRKFEKNKK
jgi:UPF0755 protein